MTADDRVRLFDSHCHLDMEEFRGDLDGVLSRAKASGVCRALLAACDEASSADVVRISGEKSGFGVELWASAGIHPHEADSAARSLPDSLPRLSERREVVAIGEIGLDYYYDNSPRDVQKDVFERQLEWAGRAKKPILVHLRNAKDRASGDAYSDAMSMIKNHPDLSGGVIHCFSGDVADARAALDLGFYVSFAGPVTYPSAATLREAAVFAPLDRILCETDSPYLAPQTKRGRRNEPAFVREVYLKLSEIRGARLEELASAIWENGERLFLFREGLIK